jgi:hypothetical protein
MAERLSMIDDGFLKCECGKKIQPVYEDTVVCGEVYCGKCKTYYSVVIAKYKLYLFERSVRK